MAINSVTRIATVLFLVGTILSACASVPENQKSESTPQSKVRDDRLTAKKLRSGECGLFVFSADNSKRFILFSQNKNDDASWWDGEKEVSIMRQSSQGYDDLGQSPMQVFSVGIDQKMTLELFAPEYIDNGIRYEAGSIKITNLDGWEKVQPVYGVSGCNTSPVISESIIRSR